MKKERRKKEVFDDVEWCLYWPERARAEELERERKYLVTSTYVDKLPDTWNKANK